MTKADDAGREWMPIKTAPKDGTPIKAIIPRHGNENIIAWTDGLRNAKDEDAGGWYFLDDDKAPKCWTDGICWTHNEAGKRSVHPTHWSGHH